MKFSIASLLLSVAQAQTVLGPSMWIMGGHGVAMYTPEGQPLKTLAKESVCHNVSSYRGDGFSVSCSFWDVATDGQKYVWASVSRGASVVDVFSIDTGDLVASLPTCLSPYNVDYHHQREEVWVRCVLPDERDAISPGRIDTFSVHSLATNHDNIKMHDNSTFNAYGRSVYPADLGDVGYATIYQDGSLYQVDLNQRGAVAAFELPNAYGSWELAYSPLNQHLYIQTYICCTCGNPGDDLDDCGHYGADNVTVVTGPSAKPGVIQVGSCGRTCIGSAADTLGVYEFDTRTNTVVGSLFSKEGATAVPVSSPTGKYILFFGGDKMAGNIRVVQPGANGQLSTVAFDLAVDTLEGFSDWAFMGDSMVALAPEDKNEVYLVDLQKRSVTTVSIDDAEESTASRRGRQVEWAQDTNYLWVSARGASDMEDKMIYVLEVNMDDMDAAHVHHTIKGVDAAKMIFVENLERKTLAQAMAQQQEKTAAASATRSSSNDDDDDPHPISIAALIVGIVALLVGAASFLSKQQQGAAITKTEKDKLVADSDTDGQGNASLQSVA